MQATAATQIDDEQLMARLACGEQAALELLYERYARPVYSLAYRILGDQRDAEEVTQDTFERVWRYAARYDHQRGRFATWLLTMTHHVAIDMLRGHRRRPGTIEGEAAERAVAVIPADASDFAEDAVRYEQADLVRQALRALPESQQQAIELAFFKGLSHLEIAAALGDPLGTVKTRIRRGMTRLKAALERRADPSLFADDDDLKEARS